MAKLFITLGSEYGGAEKYLVEIINSINKDENFEDKQLLITPNLDNFLSALSLASDQITIMDNRYKNFPYIIKNIVRICSEKSVDTIFLNGNRALYLAPFLPKNTKKIFVKHTLISEETLKNKMSNILLKFSLRYVNTVIVVSKKQKEQLVISQLCEEEKIEVIYNGIDPKFFPRQKQKDERENRTIKVAQIARIEHLKGQFDLIKAFEKVLLNYSNIELYLVGTGDETETVNLKKYIETHGFSEKVKFVGFLKDVKPILEAIDIFVLPSYTEAMPLSILEAMAASLPIISTNVGGIPEMITNKKGGYIISPGDIDDLSNKIESLVLNQNLRTAMGEYNRNVVEKIFDIKYTLVKTKGHLERKYR